MAKNGFVKNGIKLGLGLCIGKTIYNCIGNTIVMAIRYTFNNSSDDVVNAYQNAYFYMTGKYDKTIRRPMYNSKYKNKIGF